MDWQRWLVWKSNWQYLLLAGYALAIGAAFSLPFLSFIPFVPLLAFVHRFSLTVQLGSWEKTLTVLVVVAPIIVGKGAWDYFCQRGWRWWPRGAVWMAVLVMLLVNVYAVVVSQYQKDSIVQLAVLGINYGLFAATGWWLAQWWRSSPATQSKLARWFVVALVITLLINVFLSWHQFADCSVVHRHCKFWERVEGAVPSKLLPVGHQSFSNDPKVIRAPGLFGDVNFNGAFLLFAAVAWQLLLARDLRWPVAKRRWWYVGLLFITWLTFALTASRSALVAWVAVQILLAWYLWRPWWRLVRQRVSLTRIGRWLALVTIIMVGLLTVSWFLIPAPRRVAIQEAVPRYLERVGNVTTDRSAQTRVNLWEGSWQLAKNCSFLGCGLGTFSQEYQRYIDPLSPDADPHSMYMTTLVEQGIPGVLALVGLVVAGWWVAWRWLKALNKQFWSDQKKSLVPLVMVAFALAIPFYSTFAITYYGFFLPMVWWWGSPDETMIYSPVSKVERKRRG